MLAFSIIFFNVALMTGIIGFGVIAGSAATIAQTFFFIFVALFVVTLVRRCMGIV